MNYIKNLDDLPKNIFGFHPEDLSSSEKKTAVGKALMELRNITNNLGIKCQLVPSFLTGNIFISNIKKDEFQKLIQKFGAKNYTNASFGKPFSHLTIPI